MTGRIWFALRRCSRVTGAKPTAQIVGSTFWLVGQMRVKGLFRVTKFKRNRTALAERNPAVKTRTPTGMTGAKPLLVYFEPDGVLVAIDP